MGGFRNRNSLLLKGLNVFVAFCFSLSMMPQGFAGMKSATVGEVNLPAPQQFISLSKTHSFPVLKGLRLDPKNPFHIEFLIDTAHQQDVSGFHVFAWYTK